MPQGDDQVKEATKVTVQPVLIPVLVLVVAIVLGLLSLASWSLDLERRKADKTDMILIRDDIKGLREDVKELIRRTAGAGH